MSARASTIEARRDRRSRHRRAASPSRLARDAAGADARTRAEGRRARAVEGSRRARRLVVQLALAEQLLRAPRSDARGQAARDDGSRRAARGGSARPPVGPRRSAALQQAESAPRVEAVPRASLQPYGRSGSGAPDLAALMVDAARARRRPRPPAARAGGRPRARRRSEGGGVRLDQRRERAGAEAAAGRPRRRPARDGGGRRRARGGAAEGKGRGARRHRPRRPARADGVAVGVGARYVHSHGSTHRFTHTIHDPVRTQRARFDSMLVAADAQRPRRDFGGEAGGVKASAE